MPRIVFMGSPAFAIPSLAALAREYSVVGVVTQPDRPAGRGRLLTSPPVKLLAEEIGISLIQPRRLREVEVMEQLHAWRPDLIVVAAFGQILRQPVLELPPLGCINVHASLLPRWRGAAPVQAAILHGDEQTGITIMKMDAGIDTGPTLSQRSLSIYADDTAGSLGERLAALGAQLLLDTLPDYLNGVIQPNAQDDALATYAPMLAKADGLLDLNRPAEALSRQVRAYNPWPGAFIHYQDEIFKVHHASASAPGEPLPGELQAGQRTRLAGLPAVMCGDGNLLLLELVQPAGKKTIPGNVFIQGARGWDKDR